MRRREFIMLFGGAVAWPLTARAQQPAMPIIGYLSVHSAAENRRSIIEFRRGLSEAGYGEGRNVAIEYRWAVGQFPRLPELAADLVRRRVAVIVTPGSLGETLAAKAATTTIPIVFAAGGDPVKYGLVASLNRPGGNLTGVSFLTTEIVGKRLSILGELVPQATTIAFLAGGRRALTFEDQTSDVLAAASSHGRQLTVLEVRGADEFDAAFSTLIESRAGALVVGAFPLFFDQRNRDTILKLAAHHKIPAIYPSRLFADAGGLISYGPGAGVFRQLAVDYVAPILKGAKPADLPVQQATNFALTINLKTAKALGLEIPAMLLAIADDVIE
jgi:putative tryptophan/tyrosine transport system substrate-binding protein